MFGLKFKKRADTAEEKTVIPAAEEQDIIATEETPATAEDLSAPQDTAIATVMSDSVVTKNRETEIVNTENKAEKQDKDKTDFSRLADILNKDENAVLEECKLFQIRNVMSMLSKAVVRHGIDSGDMKALVKNAVSSGLGEIAASPAYLDGVAKSLGDEENLKVCSVVDFPFGESSFKVKFSEIKNSVKKGVDGVLTVINTAALKKENAKSLKKELKKIGKLKNVDKGVAVNAEDAESGDVKQVLKLTEKANIGYAAFLFGNVTETELVAKMKEINAIKGKTTVKVMANVENVQGVKTLISLGVNGIITPYADDIAKELFKEFGIKSVKLV